MNQDQKMVTQEDSKVDYYKTNRLKHIQQC